jgi:Ca2+-binding EF-hand superfamily protein
MKEEFMESFRVFGPDSNGTIPLNEFRYLMKTYGTPLSEEEIE